MLNSSTSLVALTILPPMSMAPYPAAFDKAPIQIQHPVFGSGETLSQNLSGRRSSKNSKLIAILPRSARR